MLSKEKINKMSEAFEEKLMLPFEYVLQMQNEDTGINIMSAFNYWLQIPEDKFHAIADVMQTVQKCSWLLDDIEDNASLRRGMPATHSVYGLANTLNTATYALLIGLDKTLKLEHPKAAQVYASQISESHVGQGIELYWRETFQCPSEEEYKLMAMKKISAMFGMIVRLMQLFSENKTDFSKLYDILGVYFQIRDDYCNLCSNEYADNKTFCEDITEGKFSFMAVHAVKTKKDGDKVLHILRQRTQDIKVKKYFLSLLDQLGSLQYTREEMERLDSEARAEVARLGGNPHLEALLDSMLSWRETERRGLDIDVWH